ncbi:phage portal protein [Micromonospora chokoriensis]|uniref:phage portal protein n=1 Tax=Micromonospora chokoriensis TaxID=356851 RepID=UPI0004C3696F|nr:phage portal protein [Micromonospora chokoriensis]
MGWINAAANQLRDLLSLPRPLVLDEPAAAEFDTAPRPIEQVFAALNAAGTGRVTRDEALSVAAVQKGRNSLCSIATLPLRQYRQLDIVRSPFLDQIDPDVANVVTLSQTIEDLAFDAISWWLITAQDFQGYPLAARHLDVATVSLDPPKGQPNPFPSGRDARGVKIVWVAGEATPADRVIRFDSPNPGLLSANARAIRRALLLDRLASTYADNPRPLDWFTDGDDPSVEPMDDDEIDGFLADWKASRKRGSTGWIPGNVKRVDANAPSPAELQLVELQRQVTLEIANGLGVDPEDLGVSTTSRTYFNAADRRMTKINETYAPYMTAITQRLSMGDVTPRGNTVRFDLSDYLKPDPAGQVAYWRGLYDMNVIDEAEIRAAAGWSGAPPKPKPAPAPSAPPPAAGGDEDAETDSAEQVDAARSAAMTFAADDQGPAMTFAGGDFAGGTDPAQVDVERRTITGLAVPYNKIASKYGLKFRFLPGSLQYADVSRIKHLMDHYKPVGVHESVTETKAGPVVKLRVLDGPVGSPAKLERDQLLYDAEHGLYDGLSIGVDFSMNPDDGDVEWNEKDSVYDVKRASWRETSSTPMPAFDDARVTKVAASRNAPPRVKGRSGMPDEQESTETQTTPPATGGVNLNQDQLTALLQRPGAIQALVAAQQTQQPERPSTPEGALVLSADQVDGLIRAGQLGALLGVPQLTQTAQQEPERRPTVDPTRRTTVTASVSEDLPYRFDREGNLTRGTHDFSTDLIAGSQGDGKALERAQTFMRTQFDQIQSGQFDVDRADTTALNPNRQRPDMYVDQLSYRYPVWEAINKGTLPDSTPFVLPKFATASGLVAAHTEGTEPTPGTYTATSQTITPTAVSGKVEVTREAWEQGGNPQLSGIIWRQMVKAWFESLEASAVAVLDAATPTAIALTAGGGTTGQTLASELTAAFARLQFVRGGFSMTDLFTQVDLYLALTGAKDNDGRPLFPALGPANTNGQSRTRWQAIDVNGVVALPAWALAASGAVVASSYLFDREVVHGWASAPQRLQFEYRVAYVDVALWGYKATAITDITGVREITYDPVP